MLLSEVTIENRYFPGCLEVEKIVDLTGVIGADTIDETFTITVTGPSYPGGTTLTFELVDGIITSTNPQQLSGLIPGIYTVTEADPGLEWIVTGEGDITVTTYDLCGDKTKTITNIHISRTQRIRERPHRTKCS